MTELCKLLPAQIYDSAHKNILYTGSTKPQSDYLHWDQARIRDLFSSLSGKKKKKENQLQTFIWLIQRNNAFLKACWVTQEINATHRPGWREHGLIKGKADFSSCSSCTDRQKTQKKLTTQTSFCWGPLPSLPWTPEDRRGVPAERQTRSWHRILMHKWSGAAGTLARPGVRWWTWLARLGCKSQWQFKHWNVAAAGAHSSIHKRKGLGIGTEGFGSY